MTESNQLLYITVLLPSPHFKMNCYFPWQRKFLPVKIVQDSNWIVPEIKQNNNRFFASSQELARLTISEGLGQMTTISCHLVKHQQHERITSQVYHRPMGNMTCAVKASEKKNHDSFRHITI